MKIFKTIADLKKELDVIRQKGSSLGFVPTMGALHKGHLSLIEKAKNDNDVVVCSIFVNPIQFNNKEDYIKYPRNEENDSIMLNEINCDLLFLPTEKEIYPTVDNFVFDFGELEKVMEGKFRQGHFQGVATVVKRLFEIVNPDRAYFGEKDFQQLLIIKELSGKFFPDMKIVSCPIYREPDGLAMSSRNMRLTPEERIVAPLIFKALKKVRENIYTDTIGHLKEWVEKEIGSNHLMKLEYFEIADINTLQSIEKFDNTKNCIACIAVYIGNVRLIDNIFLEKR